MLIVFDGVNGSGKSTYIRLVKDWIDEELGIETFLSQWNSHEDISMVTNGLKLDGVNYDFLYCLLHSVDVRLRIRDLLKESSGDSIILLDRYLYTEYARSIPRGITKEEIDILYKDMLQPDLVIYFDADAETIIERINFDYRSGYILGKDLNYSNDIKENFLMFLDQQIKIYQDTFIEMENVIIVKGDTNNPANINKIKTAINNLLSKGNTAIWK